jgi:hypothetical protein
MKNEASWRGRGEDAERPQKHSTQSMERAKMRGSKDARKRGIRGDGFSGRRGADASFPKIGGRGLSAGAGGEDAERPQKHSTQSMERAKGTFPRIPASPPPRLLASSPPRLLASSHLRLLASSPPRLLASSPLRLFASSPPRLLASSPPRLFASSPPRLLASSPPRLSASSPLRLLASSPPRLFASSPLRLLASLIPDLRIDQPVADISQQIAGDHQDGGEHEGSHEHGVVARQDRLCDQPPDAGP